MANQKLNATITIGGAVAGSLKSALGSTNGKLQQIGKTVTDLKNRQKELNRVIADQERLGKSGSALKVGYAQAEISAIDKQIAALRRKGDWLRRELDLTNRIKAAREKFAGQAVSRAAGAVGIGAAVGIPAFSLLKEAAQFEYDLQLIGNTAEMTREEIKALEQSIMSASKVTGQSATTLQKAIGFLVAAGMDVKTANESIITIGRTATGANANIEDLAKAAFVLNDSLKIAPKDLQVALDTLAQAGKEGNFELRDMAKVLPVLGSGMVALKMQGREAAATMGAALEIAKRGAADPDEAANNMKNFIAKVMSPETLKKAEKKFDLDLYKIIKNAQTTGKNPFEAAMTAIMQKTKGDQKAIGELFSDMQVQNFIRPLMQDWEDYQRIKDKALNASGVTDRDFDKMMSTSKSQMDRFGNSVERVRIAIGETLEPMFKSINDAIEPVIDKVETWIKQNGEMAGKAIIVGTAIAGITAAVLAVGAALSGIGFIVTTIASGFTLVGAAVAAATAAITAIIAKLVDFGSIWDSVKGAFGFGEAGPAPMSLRSPPPAPALAGSRGGQVTNTYNNDIKVTQLPGENGGDLADRIVKKMKEREAREKRSIMFDAAMAGGY